MRAEFNVTAEQWTGPATAAPGLFIRSFPARLVKWDQISFVPRHLWRATHYLTCENPLATTVTVTQAGPYHLVVNGTEDQISIPELLFPLTPILWLETVAPWGSPAYVRMVLGQWVAAQ